MDDSGYTLVELVAALAVLSIGVLAAAASAVPVSRLVRWGGAASASAIIAGARIEALRAAGCAAPGAGTAVEAGRYRVTWTVAPVGALRNVTVTVTYATGTGRGARTDAFGAVVACGP